VVIGTLRATPKRRRVACAAIALLCAGAVQAGDTAALLNPLFQDHAVLQRERENPVWGEAKPGATVTIAFAGKTLHARADDHGRWQATLPALAAGGPYTLNARTDDGSTQSIQDILVGDVWLCSGQSNMELQVERTLDSASEIHNAANDRIRMLTVSDVSSAAPLERIPAADHWLAATASNVPTFSATCYYFARELQKTTPVPMGLIVSSWGGSRIEPWMSEHALRKVGGYDDGLNLLDAYVKDPVRASTQWDRQWKAWWLSRAAQSMDNAPWNSAHSDQQGWQAAPLDRGPWQHWGMPELAGFTGMLWYRSTLKLSQEQAAQGVALSLGTANEIDQTWINGHWIGTAYGGVARTYAVPPGVLHAGDNLIAVNVLNTYRDGGIYGPADQRALRLRDGISVVLGDWQYKVVPTSFGSPPRVPWQSTSGLATLYNGMLAPLGHYGLRGVLWYQGESNTGDATHYRALLESLRDDLRMRFGEGLPFLIVQLSSYGAPPTHPGESGWADVREAQRRVAAEDPHAGLAVTVDIGERYDIHPANKQELGRRLARAARHVVYGDAQPPSGPVPVSAQRDGDGVTLSFADITGQLVAYSADAPIGFELCGTQPDSCQYAHADIRGGQIVLHPGKLPADGIARVRYCWANSPICTLYDDAGLPAGPFELPLTSQPSTR
jgi:sialate O-acetylesterase